MLSGICPYCTNRFFGIALLDPQHQKCPCCGIGRLIINDGFKATEGPWQPKGDKFGSELNSGRAVMDFAS